MESNTAINHKDEDDLVATDTAKLLAEEEEEEEQEVDQEEGQILYSHPQSGSRAEKKSYKIARVLLGIGTCFLLFGFLATAIVLVALSPPCDNKPDLPWWKTTVIYQCYPLSFQDTTGNGKGDLNGIKERAQYFSDIGVDTVWLNPIFMSPQRDNGYDISNYTDVDPLFGTLEDLESLLELLHSRGIHLLMDFVPNHTSDEHPWFIESRKDKTNPKRDWYVWADGNEFGGPPSNWISAFGGSAWTFDNLTGQYYLHQFSEFQPDLNYRNPKLRKEMMDVMKFWLDLGVDGFRMDAVIFLLENPQFTNETLNPDFHGPNCTTNISSSACYPYLNHSQTTNYDGIHDIFRDWRRVIDSYEDRFMVGEAYASLETVMEYYGTNNSEFNFPFNFFLLENTNWTGIEVSRIVSSWLNNMPEDAWPNWVLGNHDNPRIANKVGVHLARAVNTLLLTLPGTPTTYYGEELLMTNVYIPPDRRHDEFQHRDEERTPMQWNTSVYAGFSTVEPWLPVPDNYTSYNVETEMSEESSMLKLYKQLIKLRSSNSAFQYTNYSLVLNTTDVYAYHRYHESSADEFIVAVNFAKKDVSVNLEMISKSFQDPQIELSTNQNTVGPVNLTEIDLGAGEAVVIKGSSQSTGYCA